MNDLDQLLQFGLNQIGAQARPVDLDRKVAEAARSLHRRRVLAGTTAVLTALALAVPATAGVLDWLGKSDRRGVSPIDTPTPNPTAATPWISKRAVTDSTGLNGWYSSSDAEPMLCDTSAGPLLAGAVPIDGGAYLLYVGGSESNAIWTVAYTVVRFDTATAATHAYQALDRTMDDCGSGSTTTRVLDGWVPAEWQMTAEGLRQRDQLVQLDCPAPCDADHFRSTYIVQKDRYVAVATWSEGDEPAVTDPPRAKAFGQEILAGIARQEHTETPSGSNPSHDAFGPDGYGEVKLGMTLAEALAIGDLDLWAGPSETCAFADFPEGEGGGTALISRRLGVVAIRSANTDTATPEGIRINSTEAEFKRAYPGFHQDVAAVLSAPVPGNPGARYVVQMVQVGPGDPGAGSEWWVVELGLVSSAQDDCLDEFGMG